MTDAITLEQRTFAYLALETTRWMPIPEPPPASPSFNPVVQEKMDE